MLRFCTSFYRLLHKVLYKAFLQGFARGFIQGFTRGFICGVHIRFYTRFIQVSLGFLYRFRTWALYIGFVYKFHIQVLLGFCVGFSRFYIGFIQGFI